MPDTTRFNTAYNNVIQPELANCENNINTANQNLLPKFDLKLSEMEKVCNEMETPRVNRSRVKHMFITKNDEAEIRHNYANSLVSLINKNQKSLCDTQFELNKFVCEGKVNRSTDTEIFVSKFREAWGERMKTLSNIFDKACVVNREGECDDRFQMDFKTPMSFERSILFLKD